MKERAVDHYNDIDHYISYQEPGLQPMLKKIRALIRSTAPSAAESISYMVPCYKLNGMLIGFGTHKKGCSLYVMSNTLLHMWAEKLKDYTFTRSTIHLDPKKPLPVATIKKIIRYRIKQNEERAMVKNMVKTTHAKKQKNEHTKDYAVSMVQ